MKPTLKAWDRVRSADGTLYDVSYVDDKRGEAQLMPLPFDGRDYVILPLAELKRVPKTRATPIEGIPLKRPTCPFCAKPLQPYLQKLRADGTDVFAPTSAKVPQPVVRRVFQSWRGYTIERGNAFDKFCTARCARSFANAAFVAGYRIKRKDKP